MLFFSDSLTLYPSRAKYAEKPDKASRFFEQIKKKKKNLAAVVSLPIIPKSVYHSVGMETNKQRNTQNKTVISEAGVSFWAGKKFYAMCCRSCGFVCAAEEGSSRTNSIAAASQEGECAALS